MFRLSLMLLLSTAICCSKQSPDSSSPRSEDAITSQPNQASTSPAGNSSPAVQLLPAVGEKAGPAKPPDQKDVSNAVARVFDKVVTADSAGVIGDFNGDGSQDLAVVIKSDPKSLPDLNNELANWVLEDPRTVDTGTKRKPPEKPTQAAQGDSLLAIIHGIGPDGWRNPEAKQTFVLKNGAGKSMLPIRPTDLHSSKDKKQPALRGDAIQESIAGHEGLIYWTGAKYAWYSPALP